MFSLIAYTFKGELQYSLYLSIEATLVLRKWTKDSRYSLVALRRYDLLVEAKRALASARSSSERRLAA
jgi:hypothetical protein